MSDWILIGLMAGMLTTLAFIPQIVKGWRSRSLTDVSYIMLFMICAGMALWLTYGVLENDFPIILWNAVALTLNLSLVVLKFRYGKIAKTR
jgi:MtN3 and saliva related transmembrane protein